MLRIIGLVVLLSGALCAQNSDRDIRLVLDKQVSAWNRGDVRAFMDGYEATEQTTFVSSVVTHGYAAVLANYQKRYPTRENMGSLRFEILETRLLGSDYASVIGKFFLTRTKSGGGDTSGIFSLVFRKTVSGWKIILDHTS